MTNDDMGREGLSPPDSDADVEPGLDRQIWQAQWEDLEPDLRDSPIEALPDAVSIVEDMLRQLGYPIDDPVAGDEPTEEAIVSFTEARRVARQVAGGEDVDVGDVAQAIADVRDLYAYLIEDRRNP